MFAFRILHSVRREGRDSRRLRVGSSQRSMAISNSCQLQISADLSSQTAKWGKARDGGVHIGCLEPVGASWSWFLHPTAHVTCTTMLLTATGQPEAMTWQSRGGRINSPLCHRARGALTTFPMGPTKGGFRSGDKHTPRVPRRAFSPRAWVLLSLQSVFTGAATTLCWGGPVPLTWGSEEHRQRCTPDKRCWC